MYLLRFEPEWVLSNSKFPTNLTRTHIIIRRNTILYITSMLSIDIVDLMYIHPSLGAPTMTSITFNYSNKKSVQSQNSTQPWLETWIITRSTKTPSIPTKSRLKIPSCGSCISYNFINILYTSQLTSPKWLFKVSGMTKDTDVNKMD